MTKLCCADDCCTGESAYHAGAAAKTMPAPTKWPMAWVLGRERRVGIELVGCGFCRGSLRGCRRRGKLAVGPYGAVGEELLLPDGHRLLQVIEGVPAGVKGRSPMRGAARQ